MKWSINKRRVEVEYTSADGKYTFSAPEYGISVTDENVMEAQERFRAELEAKVR